MIVHIQVRQMMAKRIAELLRDRRKIPYGARSRVLPRGLAGRKSAGMNGSNQETGPTSRMGVVGAGTPPAGSLVTANALAVDREAEWAESIGRCLGRRN